ncbi:MAG: hypothetical protein LBG73_04815 [Spirochaetaceae bacterium]|nr:hypothetical protein [Spirochaetaceae bacterium]
MTPSPASAGGLPACTARLPGFGVVCGLCGKRQPAGFGLRAAAGFAEKSRRASPAEATAKASSVAGNPCEKIF